MKNSERLKWADHIDSIIGKKTESGRQLRRRVKEKEMREARRSKK